MPSDPLLGLSLDLPAGLTSRPLRADDARAVFEVMAAQELEDLGVVSIEEADIAADWARPSFDVASSTVGVLDGDRLVAYAELMGGSRADAAVHPAYRGRGVGTALAGWLRQHARARGIERIRLPTPVGSPGDRLLETLGFDVWWEVWELFLPEGAAIPTRPLPPGHLLREAIPDDYPACWTLFEDTFLEWADRDRQPYDDFLASVVGRPGFEPWHLRVVTDPGGELVGAVNVVMFAGDEAYVNKVSTRADRRGQGIAQALLANAFAVARAHGATRSGLSTDSRTGALGLYEKVGMQVTSTWLMRGTEL